jgi:FkbM family methyltransferase
MAITKHLALPREEVMRGVQREVRALCKTGISIIEHRIRCAMGDDIHVPPSIRRVELALGSGDGSWVIFPDRLSPDSVIYSFGIGTNISFDLALIRRFSCKVHAFDPTPLAIQWLKSQNLPESFLVYPWGLAAYDGSAVFTLPETHTVSFLMTTDVPSKLVAECQVRRLSTIRDLLGHDHIDLLKIDIEGSEYDVLDDIVTESARIDQLVVEFHHRWSRSPSRTEQAISRIEECGLRLFHVSARGLEYSFVR